MGVIVIPDSQCKTCFGTGVIFVSQGQDDYFKETCPCVVIEVTHDLG